MLSKPKNTQLQHLRAEDGFRPNSKTIRYYSLAAWTFAAGAIVLAVITYALAFAAVAR